jgi:hypothetical protein
MMVCKVSWCVALAAPDGVCCAIHATRGEAYRPIAGAGGGPSCVVCDGTGNCETCEGEGEHECETCSCGNSHECGACDGSGKCEDCGGTGYDLQIDPKLPWREKQRLREQAEEGFPVGADAEYLRWALETFPVPLPPLFESPWDVA